MKIFHYKKDVKLQGGGRTERRSFIVYKWILISRKNANEIMTIINVNGKKEEIDKEWVELFKIL